MAMIWDLTDVPTVEVADLAAVMRALLMRAAAWC